MTNQAGSSSPQQIPPNLLASLPPEIRGMIYELVFQDNVVQISRPRPREPRSQTNRSATPAPALLLCNKQIYREATSVYYSRTIFDNMTWMPNHGQEIASWLFRLPQSRAALITEIRLLNTAGNHKRCQRVIAGNHVMGDAFMTREMDGMWVDLEMARAYVMERNVVSSAGVLRVGIQWCAERIVMHGARPVSYDVPQRGRAVEYTADPRLALHTERARATAFEARRAALEKALDEDSDWSDGEYLDG